MEEQNYYRTRMRSKGQITLPSEIRQKLGISEGDDLAFYLNETGQVVITRLQVIPPDQAWFWSERWQSMEQEVNQDISEGEMLKFETVDDLFDYLDDTADATD